MEEIDTLRVSLGQTGTGTVGGKGIKKVAQSPLDAITNFFTQMALGALALFLVNNADKIKGIFKNIGENIEVYSIVLILSILPNLANRENT